MRAEWQTTCILTKTKMFQYRSNPDICIPSDIFSSQMYFGDLSDRSGLVASPHVCLIFTCHTMQNAITPETVLICQYFTAFEMSCCKKGQTFVNKR